MYVAPRAWSPVIKGSHVSPCTTRARAHTHTHNNAGCNISPRRTDRGPWSIGSSNILPYCWLNPFLRWWRAWTKWRRQEREREREREREKWLGCLFLLRGLTWRRLREPETDGVFIHGCEEIRETTKRSCIRWKLIWILFSLPPFQRGFFKRTDNFRDVWSKSFGKVFTFTDHLFIAWLINWGILWLGYPDFLNFIVQNLQVDVRLLKNFIFVKGIELSSRSSSNPILRNDTIGVWIEFLNSR